MNGHGHTSRLALLGGVGLLAGALGLVRLATGDDADRPPGIAAVELHTTTCRVRRDGHAAIVPLLPRRVQRFSDL